MEQMNKRSSPSVMGRLAEALIPSPVQPTDRGRVRAVANSLVLHLHPTRVVVRNLDMTYTWGLGGLSAFLVIILGMTGIILTRYYTPSPDQAYFDILNLRSNIWFGEFLRNLHHWSANLLILSSFLHLLRVVFTGSYRPPRALNWLVGIGLLLLALVGNFTGYLLPWDQLAYWAITVATSVVTYVPIIGEPLQYILLGGPEVGADTLLGFYSLHIGVIPMFLVILMAYHFWRIRKDGNLTVSRRPGEPVDEKPDKVTTLPHLVQKELAFALVWLAILVGWSMLVPAPLEGIANPAISPNPAKAAWYFLGLQELLLHFHPLVGAVTIPAIALGLLALMPFLDHSAENVGIYFRTQKGRWMAAYSAILSFFLTFLWVLADEFVFQWVLLFPDWPLLITSGVIPALVVLGILLVVDALFIQVFSPSLEERVMGMFIFLLTAFIVLTIVGIYFRGPGMAFFMPWDMPAAGLLH